MTTMSPEQFKQAVLDAWNWVLPGVWSDEEKPAVTPFKLSEFEEPGYVYAPYIPLMVTTHSVPKEFLVDDKFNQRYE
jgi:hypothetical protein